MQLHYWHAVPLCALGAEYVDAASGSFVSGDTHDASPKADTELHVLVDQTGVLWTPAEGFAKAERCPVNAENAEEGFACDGRMSIRHGTLWNGVKHTATREALVCHEALR